MWIPCPHWEGIKGIHVFSRILLHLTIIYSIGYAYLKLNFQESMVQNISVLHITKCTNVSWNEGLRWNNFFNLNLSLFAIPLGNDTTVGIWNPGILNIIFQMVPSSKVQASNTFSFSYGSNHSTTGPFQIRTFLPRFRMLFDKMAAICQDFKWLVPDFRSHSKSWPFANQPHFDHSNPD